MKIDRGTAAYLMACVEAIEDHTMRTGIEQYLTPTCTECGKTFEGYMYIWADSHLIYHNVDKSTGVETIAVLVGCEGYHLVNPGLIGLDGRNWGDWTKPETI